MIAPTANLVSPIFNILAEEKDSYDKYLIPHGTILGRFLEQRITEARNEYLTRIAEISGACSRAG